MLLAIPVLLPVHTRSSLNWRQYRSTCPRRSNPPSIAGGSSDERTVLQKPHLCRPFFRGPARAGPSLLSPPQIQVEQNGENRAHLCICLLYTSDAADDLLCVDL